MAGFLFCMALALMLAGSVSAASDESMKRVISKYVETGSWTTVKEDVDAMLNCAALARLAGTENMYIEDSHRRHMLVSELFVRVKALTLGADPAEVKKKDVRSELDAEFEGLLEKYSSKKGRIRLRKMFLRECKNVSEFVGDITTEMRAR